MFKALKKVGEEATHGLTPTARTLHLVYFGGVFIESHGFYGYAALGLLVVEGVLWLLGHGE